MRKLPFGTVRHDAAARTRWLDLHNLLGTPLTARLFKPVLAYAQTARVTDSRALPWYLTALPVSQPLHFGDYGGLGLKAVWALVDIITLIVLSSELYL
jgi:uncharacterized iron-regulated membrane protein